MKMVSAESTPSLALMVYLPGGKSKGMSHGVRTSPTPVIESGPIFQKKEFYSVTLVQFLKIHLLCHTL